MVSLTTICFLFFNVLLITQLVFSRKLNEDGLDDIQELLFPRNQTNRVVRKLGSATPAPVPCVTCNAMSVCTSLNGLLVEEVYYPNNLEFRETCIVLDQLGFRAQSAIFGNGRTFRDTVQCREIVMEYLCLFYGSNNTMYKNNCADQISTDSSPSVYAPRAPCRSFCVQVATVCANSPDFIITCNEIPCPQLQGRCTPDPSINGEPLAANLGCAVPYTNNPYFKSTASRLASSSVIVSFAITFILLYELLR